MAKRSWLDWIGLGTKASATTRAIVSYFSPGQAVWTPVAYDRMAKEGYQKSVYGYRSIQLIAQAIAGIRIRVYDESGETNELVSPRHPLQRLLDKPNPLQSGSKFRENFCATYLISGNSYIERVGPDKGAPRELYSHRSDRMRVKVGDSINPVAGYQYWASAMWIDMPYEFVKHIKTFHPNDDWYGMAPMEAIARSIDANNATKDWNVALMQNSGQPSGALISKETMTDKTFNRLKAQIRDEYTGIYNAGVPLLLEGDLDWKQMSLKPIDMSWLESQQLSAREIAVGFGVPPEFIGDANKTYANYAEARKAFYEETVLPLLDMFCEELSEWLCPLFGENLILGYEKKDIEALREDRDAVVNRLDKGYNSGWATTDEVREAAGLQPDPVNGKKYKWEVQPSGGQGGTQEAAQDPSQRPQKVAKKADPQMVIELERKWELFELKRKPYYGAVEQVIKRRFAQEEAQLTKLAAEAASAQELLLQIDDLVNKFEGEWHKVMVATYETVGESTGKATLQELKNNPHILETKIGAGWLKFITDYVRKVGAEKVTSILDTTKKKLRAQIEESIREDEAIPQTVERIRKVYAGFDENRAITIARTEVIGASNAGSFAAAKSIGVGLKKTWVSTPDSRVRGRDDKDKHSHLKMQGQTVDIDGLFVEPLTGEKLMFPGDSSHGASAANTIQCRCIVSYEEDE